MGESFVSLVKACRESLENGGKILICGNGGSATQADHFTAELISDGLACISLTNPAIITTIANDYSYEEIFSKQIHAFGEIGDILICLTTSSTSKNIVLATSFATKIGVKAFTITNSEAPIDRWTTMVTVPNSGTQGIQEDTLKLLHRLWGELKWISTKQLKPQ